MKVYTDANPTTTCWVAGDDTRVTPIISECTNNEAEYLAILRALQNNLDDVDIYSDSQLVVNQLNHKWSIKEDKLRTLAVAIWEVSRGRKVTFNWIPRKENLAGKVLG